MSGGSYDYFCFKVDNFIADLRLKNDPKRIALKDLLRKVSTAVRAIEWEDSGDTGKDWTDESIDYLFNSLCANPDIIIKASAYDELKEVLKKYIKE